MANQSKGFKKFMAMAYGLGAAVVIVGALFKIIHSIGLVTEAIIFALSAFEPVEDELDWAMLKEARVDSSLFESLGESVRSFEGAAKGISPTIDSINSQKKYSEEMTLAAQQMESLNGLYKVQLESSQKQSEANQAIADNASKLQEQMESLATNLSSLNGVYGGMLSAMSKN